MNVNEFLRPYSEKGLRNPLYVELRAGLVYESKHSVRYVSDADAFVLRNTSRNTHRFVFNDDMETFPVPIAEAFYSAKDNPDQDFDIEFSKIPGIPELEGEISASARLLGRNKSGKIRKVRRAEVTPNSPSVEHFLGNLIDAGAEKLLENIRSKAAQLEKVLQIAPISESEIRSAIGRRFIIKVAPYNRKPSTSNANLAARAAIANAKRSWHKERAEEEKASDHISTPAEPMFQPDAPENVPTEQE